MKLKSPNRGPTAETPPPGDEVKELRRTLRDLVSLSALPAIWVDGDLKTSLQNLTDVLCTALRAFTVCLKTELPDGSGLETGAASGLGRATPPRDEVTEILESVAADATGVVEIPRFNGNTSSAYINLIARLLADRCSLAAVGLLRADARDFKCC